MKLGSLFDGSGGFPLAATRAGITPIWASEIEPYPIAVTQAHFPSMRHYGDVSKIDGGKVEPVDVITFGSPCQDLSVCGCREGLSGSRSSLFFEAIRIIKEMRSATNDKKPRYAIWENVLGSLTSNGGNDFSQVVNQFLELVDLGPVARPPFWKRAGLVVADRFSLSWRVLDAQFFGVPQRRKRLFLVADFRGESAPEILVSRSSSVSSQTVKSRGGDPEVDRSSSERIEFYSSTHTDFDKRLNKNVFGTLTKCDYKAPPTLYIKGEFPRHITPNEAGRLQGFPANYGKIGAISDDKFPFWRKVWDDYARVFNRKRRSDGQVKSWMRSPYSEYAEYQMWGNGVALPCVQFILDRVASFLKTGSVSKTAF